MKKNNKVKVDKKGILLVSFGTTVPTAKVALENMHQKVREAFPGVEIRWAYTSVFIRKKLSKQGEEINSPVVALSKMTDDGFTHIAVQSMHTIPGAEYEYLAQNIAFYKQISKGPEKIELGFPLLYSHEDIEATVSAMIANFPKISSKEAIVLMGHGTSHFSNVFYPALNYYFKERINNVFIGTVEGHPTIQDVILKLKSNAVDKVFLMPFLCVAGDHTKRDMCGDNKNSWKNILVSEGFKVECVIKGTGEIDEVVSIWVKHLEAAFNQL